MPAKMVNCVLCNELVSKRSTLSLKELGYGEGRACRTHKVVSDLVESKRVEEKETRQIERAERKIRIISHAAFVRAMHTIQGWPEEYIYGLIRAKGFSKDHIKQVREMVASLGGPLMRQEEVLASILARSTMMEKSQSGSSETCP